MNFKEIELKYRANGIKLDDFKAFAESLNPARQINAGSYDHYFVKSDAEFIRYRAGNYPELTVKIKSNDKDNFVRTEVNLPLDRTLPEFEAMKIVTAFCDNLRFRHNFTIYKTYSVYFYEDHNIVYYVVYDANLCEKERFIEIEMDENKVWESQTAAWSALEAVERKCASIGIGPQKRVKKSLYELFRKNTQ